MISTPRDLATIAKEIGAEYITYSTDFVLDGKRKTAYTEEGEKLVLESYDKSFVVRTSWVFGIAKNNFNKQVINWFKGKEELSIVDDKVSSPTYSWELIKTKQYGLYHLSNDGEASKYNQAKYVLESISWNGTLNKAKSSDFSLPAERAKYSKLDCKKLEKVIGMKIPDWKDGIDRFLEELNNG